MEIHNRHFCIGCMKELYNKEVCSYCGLEQKSYTPVPRCLIPGTRLADRYVLGKILGEGSFGITYIGWDELLTIPVAIKEYYPSDLVSRDVLRGNATDVYLYAGMEKKEYDKKLDKFLEEARNLTRFNHLKAIVSVRDFFYANNTAYIVMDYIRGESLKSYIKRNGAMEAKEVLRIFRPVLESLEKMHLTGILHRDISPDNLLFDEENNLVLIDFGSAELQNADLTRSITINFKRGFSPEEQYRTHGKQGPWTDVYALCTSMYYAMTGVVPDEAIQRTIEDRVKPLWQYKNIDLSNEQMRAVMKGMAVQGKNRYQNVTQLYYQLYNATSVIDLPTKKMKWYYVAIMVLLLFVLGGIWYVQTRESEAVEAHSDLQKTSQQSTGPETVEKITTQNETTTECVTSENRTTTEATTSEEQTTTETTTEVRTNATTQQATSAKSTTQPKKRESTTEKLPEGLDGFIS